MRVNYFNKRQLEMYLHGKLCLPMSEYNVKTFLKYKYREIVLKNEIRLLLFDNKMFNYLRRW